MHSMWNAGIPCEMDHPSIVSREDWLGAQGAALESRVTLAELFAGRSQLFIKNFMMASGQVGQCVEAQPSRSRGSPAKEKRS